MGVGTRADVERMGTIGRKSRLVALALLLTSCREEARDPEQDAQPNDASSHADAALDAAESGPTADDSSTPLEASSAQTDADADASVPLRWHSLSLVYDTTPRTQAVELLFAPATESVTLRVSAATGAPDPNLCFALEEVWANTDERWVDAPDVDDYDEYCRHCTQRVSVSPGYGLFALPSNTQARSTLERLRLRVALRECDTLLPWPQQAARPAGLQLEWAESAAVREQDPVALEVGVVLASERAFPSGVNDPQLREALALTAEVLRQASIEVTWRGPIAVQAPANEAVRFGPGQRAPLDTLATSARAALGKLDARAMLVVLTPCLIQDDLLSGSPRQLGGYTPHLPGGFGLTGAADGAFVAVESCGGLPPPPRFLSAAPLAAVIAHELGHMLGLYHVMDAGGQEDQLADTQPSVPNLMQRMPSAGATALSPEQIRVVRRHLALARSTSPSD